MSDGPNIRLESLSSQDLRTLAANFRAAGRHELADAILREVAARRFPAPPREGTPPAPQSGRARRGHRAAAVAGTFAFLVLVSFPAPFGDDAAPTISTSRAMQASREPLTDAAPETNLAADAPRAAPPARRVRESVHRELAALAPPSRTEPRVRLAVAAPPNPTIAPSPDLDRVSVDGDGLLPAAHCDKGLSPAQQLICEDAGRVSLAQRTRQSAPSETRVLVRRPGRESPEPSRPPPSDH